MNSMQSATKFDQWVKEGKPIYVLNRTNPPAVVSLTLAHPRTGEKRYGAIPPTFVPIDLSALFPRTILRESYDIRQYLLKGILELIPQKRAERILAQPDAQEELERIASSKFSGRNVTEAMKSLRDANKDIGRLQRDAELEAGMEEGEDEPINDKVRDICVRLEEGSLKANEALAQLKSIQHILIEADYQYILSTVDSGKIKKWVKEKLAQEVNNGKSNKKASAKNRRVENEDEDEDSNEANNSSDEETDVEESSDENDDEDDFDE